MNNNITAVPINTFPPYMYVRKFLMVLFLSTVPFYRSTALNLYDVKSWRSAWKVSGVECLLTGNGETVIMIGSMYREEIRSIKCWKIIFVHNYALLYNAWISEVQFLSQSLRIHKLFSSFNYVIWTIQLVYNIGVMLSFVIFVVNCWSQNFASWIIIHILKQLCAYVHCTID